MYLTVPELTHSVFLVKCVSHKVTMADALRDCSGMPLLVKKHVKLYFDLRNDRDVSRNKLGSDKS